MFRYLLVSSLFLSLLGLYESRAEVSSEVVDINDPEVKEAALFVAQEMSFGRMKYKLDEITEAKKVIGSDVMYEIGVVLSDYGKCSSGKSIGCKRTIRCKVDVRKENLSEKRFKLESFGCTPLAIVRRRKPSKVKANKIMKL